MKKSLGALKEKFGKFEISKEQVKKTKGGGEDCTYVGGSDGWVNCGSGGSGLNQTLPGSSDDNGTGGGSTHCPPNISEQWCHDRWTYPCGNFEVCFDPAGYSACIATCKACCKC